MSKLLLTPWTLILCAIVALFMETVVAQLAHTALVDDEGMRPIEAKMLATAVGAAFVLVFTVLLLRRLKGGLGINWLGGERLGFHLVGAYVVFGLLWWPLCVLAYPLLLQWLGVTPEAQPHLAYFTDPDVSGPRFWGCIGMICLLGPVVEELVFRGFLQTGLRRMFAKPWTAIIVTGFLFGLMHSVQVALPIALMGCFFGYLRERSGGLLIPIAAHVLHNSLTVAVTINRPELLSEVFGK